MTGEAKTRIEAKARGAFYTPPELTRFLACWAIRRREDRVLEPSCGDGAFVAAAADRLRRLGVEDLHDQLIAIERENQEAEKALCLAPTANLLVSDFFEVDPSEVGVVDAVIGNPPYIRYHGFTGADRERALSRARDQGVVLTNLASSWAHFVAHSVAFLRTGGRLALVLPAELLHTEYGQPIRELLLRRFGSVVVIAFDRLVFSDAQVDAVLLLASADDDLGLRVIRVEDERSLESLDIGAAEDMTRLIPAGRWSHAVDGPAGKVYAEIAGSGRVVRLGAIASVDIGFVSGANDFFVLSAEEATRRHLPAETLTPALRRPGDTSGLLASLGDPRLLLDLGRRPRPTDEHVVAYLEEGAATGIPDRYKCRVRTPWYGVPLPRRKPDAFLPYMAYLAPRLIVNDLNAWSSNLIHGVSLGLFAPPVRALAAAMTSTVTLLSAEIEGRAYGGGVLKLETKEAERLTVPDLSSPEISRLEGNFDAISALIAEGKIEASARISDAVLGIDHDRLWDAYLTFRTRRLDRRRRHAA